MSSWISVKDRLPELGVTVLGWGCNGLGIVYCEARLGSNTYVWLDECGCYDGNTVTHWMPMIEGPPEEKE